MKAPNMNLQAVLVSVCLGATLVIGAPSGAQQQPEPLKIGFLADLSGSTASGNGNGATEAGRMAVEDFGGTVLGRPIVLLSRDFQGKPDIGINIAREWLDVEKVKAIVNINNSTLALAVQNLAVERGGILMFTGAASSDLTGTGCSPNSTQWIIDTYALGHGAAKANVPKGLKKWAFITVDYAYGKRLEADTTAAVLAAGGSVVASVRHPAGVADFSSFVLQVQASAPDVLALANSTSDTANAVKQAREFGLTMPIVPLLLLTTDIHSLGLSSLSNVRFLDQFYWDTDQSTRAWSKRFFERTKAMPSSVQADGYRAVMHYLQSVQAAGTEEASAVMKKMKELPLDDAIGKGGWIREDGRVMRDLKLYEVKPPTDSKYPWDYQKAIGTIQANDVYRPLAEGGCPFLQQQR
jgi:branched-chain amino acid transport system substrate-binding protein